MENKDERVDNINSADYEGLEEIIEFLRSVPEPMFRVINKPKYQKMLNAASILRDMLCDDQGDVSVEVDILKKFNMGAVTVKAASLEVLNPVRFSEAIKDADNIEVFPHTDDSIEINLTFHSIFISI